MTEQRPPRRRVYWLADTLNDMTRQRASNLQRHGFEVRFFNDLLGFKTQVLQLRPAIVVLSLTSDSQVTLKTIQLISSMPEIRAAKMLLVGASFDERISALAACSNFRDILPLGSTSMESPDHLDFIPQSGMDNWTQRFIFATSGRPKGYRPPHGQITTAIGASIGVPARIAWISKDRMCIESRARPPVGSQIRIGGHLAASYGLDFLPAIVESARKQRLLYHFSEAQVVRWRAPQDQKDRTDALFASLQDLPKTSRSRVYVAIQDATLRGAVLSHLEAGPYEVGTALKKQGIADEPRFFTPDLVILENTFITRDNLPLLKAMISTLQPHTSVIILGSEALTQELEMLYPNRRFLQIQNENMESLTSHLKHAIFKLLLNSPQENIETKDAVYLPSNHSLSESEIQIPGRIVKLHPVASQLSLDYPVGRYALIRIMCPLLKETLGRSPFAKVTACSTSENTDEEKKVSHRVDCYFADIHQDEMKSLARLVWQTLTSSLLQYMDEKEATELRPWTKLGHPLPLSSSPLTTAALLGAQPAIETPTAAGATTAPQPRISLPKKKNPRANGTFRLAVSDFGKAVGIIGGALLILWAMYMSLAPRIEHSGAVYSDQLKKFAPHRNPEQGPSGAP